MTSSFDHFLELYRLKKDMDNRRLQVINSGNRKNNGLVEIIQVSDSKNYSFNRG